jgi:hypothetical protein
MLYSTNTAAIAVPVVLTLVIVGLVGGWMYYAFTHPNTASGQWLIEVCVNLFNINVHCYCCCVCGIYKYIHKNIKKEVSI